MGNVVTLYPNEDKLKRFITEHMLSQQGTAVAQTLIDSKNPVSVATYYVNRIFAVLRQEEIALTFRGEVGRLRFEAVSFIQVRTLETLAREYAARTDIPSARDVLTDAMGFWKSIGIILVTPPYLIS